jgi:tetratricopeptide (TPR) repeat protein
MIMKTLPIITLLLASLTTFSQTLSLDSGETYAVVVGISDYQDEDIPDLRFADKDALAFAGFLQSPAGGELDEGHLKVLINEQATVAQFAIALDWLWEVVKENDKVIIYFSGHGDVERKSITQPGYLLCWDAPSKIYLAGGALALPMFQDVITTLSAQNKAKVIVITDACRSGKLSGSSVGGAQITGSNIAKQYANEIKILSCQPDEYSIEGEQWGGGRGAFSYHLLEGLYGMADGDNDLSVNLKEIDRYLEDKVSMEVAPQSQNPMTVGGKMEKLTTVFPDILKKLRAGKREQMSLFTATDSRGIEDDVLAQADTNIVEMYFAFQKSLEDKQFLSAETGRAENDYADFYYKKLSEEPSLERLHSTMRRNYAAALQDDAQQVMNNWMKTGVDQVKTRSKEFKDKVKTFPWYLDRAAELLDNEHYMYTTLIARKHFFEGYILLGNSGSRDSIDGEKALKFFREALMLQPEMPQAYWQMSRTYIHKFYQPDSAIAYTNKAIELYPSWILPYTDLAFSLSYNFQQFDKAKLYLDRAMKIDSTSPYVWNAYSVFNYFQGRTKEGEKCLRKVIQYDSTNVQAYQNLGNIKKNAGQYVEAEKYFLKAFQFDSTNYWVVRSLGTLYLRTDRLAEAEHYLMKAITMDPRNADNHLNLAEYYQEFDRWEESEATILKAIELESTSAIAFAMLGYTYTHLPGKLNDAEKTLNKALEMNTDLWYTYIYLAKWSFMTEQLNKTWEYLEQGIKKSLSLRVSDYEALSIDFLENRLHFDELHNDPKWDELMQKYFPDEYKR